MSRLQHSKLGVLEGLTSDNGVQFHGVKYGSLDHRFGAPKMYSDRESSGVVNARKLGYIDLHFPPQSDTECLNLSVPIPNDGARAGKKLLVFVFIHGGGLAFGSGTWPQYDQAKIIGRFLTSEELRKAKFRTNNGLRDQKVAFEWVRAHIEGFGDDPNQFTAVGQSAGGVSLTTLFQCSEELFQRMIVLSGSCLLRRPVSLGIHKQFYLKFCKAQGFEGISGEDRIRAIEERESLELLLKISLSIPSLPALDHDLLKKQISFEKAKNWSDTQQTELPGLEWCKELVFVPWLILCINYQASICMRALMVRGSNVAQQLSDSLNRALPDHELAIGALLDDYGISQAANNDLARHAILQLVNHLSFYLPCDVFAQSFPGRRYIYCLNEPNPWDGPFKGEAAHVVDVSFLFKNFEGFLPTRTKDVAQAFSDNIVKFISGNVPWQASSGENRVALVYGNEAGAGQLRKDEPEYVGRRAAIFRYQDSIGYDALLDAFSNFPAGM